MLEMTRKEERKPSLQIAEISGKRRTGVMRAIRNMKDALVNVRKSNFALADCKGNVSVILRPHYKEYLNF